MDGGSESKQRITRGPGRGLPVAIVVGMVLLAVWIVGDVRGGREEPAAPAPSTSARTATTASTPPTQGPGLIEGVPLEGPTSLELVVGETLVDVDRDLRTWVGGADDHPKGEAAGMSVFRVGADTVIVRYFSCDGCGSVDVRVLVLRHGTTRPEQILAGGGFHVAPGLDGIWVVRRETDTCTAGKLALDGTAVATPRQIRCGWAIRTETPIGLVADSRMNPDGVPIPTSYLLDPTDLSVRFHADRIVAVSEDRMLVGDARGETYELRGLNGPGRPFPALGSRVADRGAVSPDGRYVVLEARLDEAELWVADLEERRWERVPVGVHAGLLSRDWADDGRLVLFGPLVDGTDNGDRTLATWRPGDEQLAVRPVDYPPGQLAVRSPSR